jgi:hypothetical protein
MEVIKTLTNSQRLQPQHPGGQITKTGENQGGGPRKTNK